jgi:uncharacterized membrane protein YoaK (UPF0700 family)
VTSRRIRLIALLSFVAGFVDTAGFVALFGLFTAYITGNLSVLAAEFVRRGEKTAARILILPVFILTVAATTLYIRHHDERGSGNLLQRALALQIFLLLLALAVALALGPPQHPNGPTMLIVGPLLVTAMAVQNAATRLVVRPPLATTLMTFNITQLTIDIVDLWRGTGSESARMQIRQHLKVVSAAIASFILGAAGGAFGFYIASFWCLVVPLFVLGLLVGSGLTSEAVLTTSKADV